MKALAGKTIVVTGASQGLGAVTTKLLAQAGAQVVLAARSSAKIETIAAEINQSGGKALAVPCDVSNWPEVEKLIALAEAAFGPVDVLINNAGIIEPITAIAESDPAEWGKAIDINLKGVYYGMRAVMPGMLARGHGTLITVGSGAANFPLEGWSAYCSAKAGALMLTKAGEKETGEHGLVHINLSPGTIRTDMQARIRASGINPVSQMNPDDLGDPVIPAQILIYLCGPGGTDYAGQDIRAADEQLRAKAGIT